jgi:uncharacterized protein Yka (UPF0111/DUF47 family)
MMADKQQLKAKNIVDKSLQVFSDTINQIEKANDLLEKSIESDEVRMQALTAEINEKYQELDVIQADKLNKIAEIRSNKDLIAKLEKFVK